MASFFNACLSYSKAKGTWDLSSICIESCMSKEQHMSRRRLAASAALSFVVRRCGSKACVRGVSLRYYLVLICQENKWVCCRGYSTNAESFNSKVSLQICNHSPLCRSHQGTRTLASKFTVCLSTYGESRLDHPRQPSSRFSQQAMTTQQPVQSARYVRVQIPCDQVGHSQPATVSIQATTTGAQ